jgi:D-beta-D-heptose 7-phosphate kinase/D-beta-D-heptose 1-phosphate adenosyltransferase
MSAELSTIIQQAAGRRVLLVGDLMLDRYVYGDAERISPEAPVPVLRVVERDDRVGGSGSVAACLRSLGVEVTICGLVGQDGAGQRLRDLLAATGADLSGMITASDRPTITKTRLVGLAQARHRQQLLRLDEESTGPVAVSDRDRLRDFALTAVQQADAICIEDYEKGVVTAEFVAELVKAARARGIPVLVDPGRISDYSRYRGATLLTPNRKELALAVGYESTKHEEIAALAEKLRGDIAAHAIVVTLDREGALLVSEGEPWRPGPTRPRSV